MTALYLPCIVNGVFSPTPEQVQKLLDFLCDDAAVSAALNETQADDKPAVNEAPFVDDFSLPGYDYLGTRCMVSGGDVQEIDSKQEGDETEIPY